MESSVYFLIPKTWYSCYPSNRADSISNDRNTATRSPRCFKSWKFSPFVCGIDLHAKEKYGPALFQPAMLTNIGITLLIKKASLILLIIRSQCTRCASSPFVSHFLCYVACLLEDCKAKCAKEQSATPGEPRCAADATCKCNWINKASKITCYVRRHTAIHRYATILSPA